jgi:hypothetical protein
VRGSGNVVEEERSVSGVRVVELATIGRLQIEVGERERLRIEGEDNLLPQIETEIRDGKLAIKTQTDVRLRATQPLRYVLRVTELEAIVVSSSGDVKAGDMTAEAFSVTLSSSGNLELGDLACDTLRVQLSSSGDMSMGLLDARTLDVRLSSSGHLSIAGGEVEEQTITISGSGDYAAKALDSAQAKVTLSSSGTATIQVRDALSANLSSSGDLTVVGDPTTDVTRTSSGKVVQIKE